MSNLVSIGQPIANSPGRYCGSSPFDARVAYQALFDAIATKRLKTTSPPLKTFSQQVHLGVDGVVIFNSKNAATDLFLQRERIAKFALGVASDGRHAMIMVTRGTANDTWAAHVVDMDSPNAEQMVEAGETMLIQTWPQNAIPLAFSAGHRGGQVQTYNIDAVVASTRGHDAVDVVTVVPTHGSFGFTFSTNGNDLFEGVNHYVSSVDKDGGAALAGLKPGDRILKVNDLDVTNYSHEAVIEMIRRCPPQSPLNLTVQGPNDLIRSSMKQKERQLKWTTRPSTASLMGVGKSFSAAQHTPLAVSGTAHRSTLVATNPAGGVPESDLGSVPFGLLEQRIFAFATQFCVPDGLPHFDPLAEGRSVVDLALFRSRVPTPRTIALAICSDVLVASLADFDTPMRTYTLAAAPTARDKVHVEAYAKNNHDDQTFRIQLGSSEFILRATSPEECAEWIQILSNPLYLGRKGDVITPTIGSPSAHRKKQAPIRSSFPRTRDPAESEQHQENGVQDEATLISNPETAAEEEPDVMATHDADVEPRDELDIVVSVHPLMTRDEADALMRDVNCESGRFFFREHKSGSVALTVGYKNKSTHHLLYMDEDDGTYKYKSRSAQSGAYDLAGAASLEEVVVYLRSTRSFWPVPLTEQIAYNQGDGDDNTKDVEEDEKLLFPARLHIGGRRGHLSYINGNYVLHASGGENGSSPVYRHDEQRVYDHAHDVEEYVYLYFSFPNETWCLGSTIGSTNVIGFCDSQGQPYNPPLGPTTWHFLHDDIVNESVVDSTITLTHVE